MNDGSAGAAIFYVYVLFDHCGIPRYIGKGHGNRWKQHESEKEKRSNYRKFRFIRETLAILGEIPKVKVRQQLTEPEAFEIERAFIAALGRFPEGPLVNRTDNRNGPSSEQTRAWHASRTPEQRAARALRIREGILARSTPEQRAQRARKNNAAVEPQVKAARMAAWQASRSPEERRSAASRGGTASALAASPEELVARGLRGIAAYMATTTKEQRQENAKRSGVGMLTKQQLSENGRKGVTVANSNRTPEERSALARKARAAQLQSHDR